MDFRQGGDYLFYALIDAVVDSYFTMLNKIGEKTEHKEFVENRRRLNLLDLEGKIEFAEGYDYSNSGYRSGGWSVC